jgi:23S rRNA A2030 N6-methylase RlmJ
MPSTPTSRSPLAPSRQVVAPSRVDDAFFSASAASSSSAPRGNLFCSTSSSSLHSSAASHEDAALLLELRAADELELAAPVQKRARRAERGEEDGAHAVTASVPQAARPLMRPGDASPEHLRRLERLVAKEEKAEKELAARSKSSPAKSGGV